MSSVYSRWIWCRGALRSVLSTRFLFTVLSKNGVEPGLGTNSGGGKAGTGPDPQSGNGVGARGTQAKKNKESEILKLIQKPWFIGAVGGFFWVLICIIVFVIVFKRRKRGRKTPEFLTEQTNGKFDFLTSAE